MKKIFLFTLAIALIIPFPASSQKQKNQFHSINTFELISGESNSSIGFQTVDGIQFSKWFSGFGIGVDKYHFKTIPFFFDLRKYFDKDKRAFFYGDIGYNFPIKKQDQKVIPYNSNYHFNGGIYLDAGIGYLFPFAKRTAFLISMGYSYKKLENKMGAVNYCPFVGPCPESYTTNRYSLGRIIFKSGFVF
jgi:hypothetical protein